MKYPLLDDLNMIARPSESSSEFDGLAWLVGEIHEGELGTFCTRIASSVENQPQSGSQTTS